MLPNAIHTINNEIMDKLTQKSSLGWVADRDRTIASNTAPRMTRKMTRALQKSGKKYIL